MWRNHGLFPTESPLIWSRTLNHPLCWANTVKRKEVGGPWNIWMRTLFTTFATGSQLSLGGKFQGNVIYQRSLYSWRKVKSIRLGGHWSLYSKTVCPWCLRLTTYRFISWLPVGRELTAPSLHTKLTHNMYMPECLPEQRAQGEKSMLT